MIKLYNSNIQVYMIKLNNMIYTKNKRATDVQMFNYCYRLCFFALPVCIQFISHFRLFKLDRYLLNFNTRINYASEYSMM